MLGHPEGTLDHRPVRRRHAGDLPRRCKIHACVAHEPELHEEPHGEGVVDGHVAHGAREEPGSHRAPKRDGEQDGAILAGRDHVAEHEAERDVAKAPDAEHRARAANVRDGATHAVRGAVHDGEDARGKGGIARREGREGGHGHVLLDGLLDDLRRHEAQRLRPGLRSAATLRRIR